MDVRTSHSRSRHAIDSARLKQLLSEGADEVSRGFGQEVDSTWLKMAINWATWASLHEATQPVWISRVIAAQSEGESGQAVVLMQGNKAKPLPVEGDGVVDGNGFVDGNGVGETLSYIGRTVGSAGQRRPGCNAGNYCPERT
jgi:hypothetical protein